MNTDEAIATIYQLMETRPYDVLVLRVPAGTDQEEIARCAEGLRFKHPVNVLIMPMECELQQLDAEAMRAAGWVRQSEVDAKMRHLTAAARELRETLQKLPGYAG